MDRETIKGALAHLSDEDLAAVVVAGIALLGASRSEDVALTFESAVRSHGAQGEDAVEELYNGGGAIYGTVNDLDNRDFDFDEAADDDDDD